MSPADVLDRMKLFAQISATFLGFFFVGAVFALGVLKEIRESDSGAFNWVVYTYLSILPFFMIPLMISMAFLISGSVNAQTAVFYFDIAVIIFGLFLGNSIYYTRTFIWSSEFSRIVKHKLSPDRISMGSTPVTEMALFWVAAVPIIEYAYMSGPVSGQKFLAFFLVLISGGLFQLIIFLTVAFYVSKSLALVRSIELTFPTLPDSFSSNFASASLAYAET